MSETARDIIFIALLMFTLTPVILAVHSIGSNIFEIKRTDSEALKFAKLYGVTIAVCIALCILVATIYNRAVDTREFLASTYQEGQNLIDQGKLEEALEKFEIIGPGWKDTSDIIDKLKSEIENTPVICPECGHEIK